MKIARCDPKIKHLEAYTEENFKEFLSETEKSNILVCLALSMEGIDV